MTTRVRLQLLSDNIVKVTTMTLDGKIHAERLVMNREPQEFDISQGNFLTFSEAERADSNDPVQVAKEAAAKEPQHPAEVKNPQTNELGKGAKETPIANVPAVQTQVKKDK